MLTDTSSVSQVGNLILARLLVPSKRALSRSELRRQLAPYYVQQPGDPSWETLLDMTLHDLEQANLLQTRPCLLTLDGRAKALAFLGLQEVPPRLNWARLRDGYLVPRVLGTSAASRKDMATVNGLRRLLAAQAVGARSGEARELRLAILRRWLDGCRSAPVQTDPPRHAAVQPAADDPRPLRLDERPLNLAVFAETVREAAQGCTSGRFGDKKVFISHVWRKLQEEGLLPGISQAEF